MHRREFMKWGIEGSLASLALAATLNKMPSLSANQEINWSMGWRSVAQDSFSELKMQIDGKLPKGLNGLLLRNGPAKMERSEQHYHHWFDGDGMVQQFVIGNGHIVHKGKYIETQKYLEEEAAQRFIYNGAGTVFENAQSGRNNDSINTANTALLPWDNEVLALWEGGSAYSIEAESLQTLGLKTWRSDLQHMPFSAHPLVDPSGDMWNFGFAPYAGPKGKIIIYQIAPKSGVKQVALVDLPFSGYMHDFAQTKHSLVFLVPPYTFTNSNGRSFVSKFEWQPSLGSRLLIVDKRDLSKQKWFDLPAGFVFHFGHASEHQGILQVNVCWYENADLMSTGMQELMSVGKQTKSQQAMASTIIANLNTGQANITKSSTSLEFPNFNSNSRHAKEQANSPIWGISHQSSSSVHSDMLVSWSPYSGMLDRYNYPEGVMVEEPILLPKNSRENEGNEDLIVQTFLDVKHKKSGLNIFVASQLANGPITQATMDRTLPLGFHGTFVA